MGDADRRAVAYRQTIQEARDRVHDAVREAIRYDGDTYSRAAQLTVDDSLGELILAVNPKADRAERETRTA